ncbi:tetratricopeptide repeat protein [Shimia sp. R11_0]|uniref:tetratricopeptide repeat protein n=1 Tax=Shimia sp. R11_0 TaxID=2821096 RepID=UPI001ADAFA74|nr:tetratricopeptide repeat protein [Shimia sp. R11_0]MBO9477557.1 tetratricopeptide repeat protein [Shimia sp. R11_0]
MRILFALLLSAGSAAASSCPQPPDHSEALDRLFDRIQRAPDPATAQTISNDMWGYWTDAPDDTAQEILNRGMRKRAGWDLLGAQKDFDALVAYCPEYAEGYNQRAFVNFLAQDFEAALPDLQRALELSPRHVGAHSGLALTLIGLGREAAAQDALAAALELNPWLPERSLYKSAAPKSAPGKEL